MRIRTLTAKKILDSRKKPTIQVFVNGCSGAAPSGTSKSKYEALDYPISAAESAKFVNAKLKNELVGFKFNDFSDLEKLEQKLPSIFGANPTIALEFAILNAWSRDEKKPLWKLLNPKAKVMPRLLANVVGGGAHAIKPVKSIQEFLISPQTASFESDVKEAQRIHKEIGKKLRARSKDLENAWITTQPIHKILNLLSKVAGQSQIGCDIAASTLFAHNEYHWRDFGALKADKHLQIISNLTYEFGLFYLEDPFEQNAVLDFAKLLKKQKYSLVCGDDLVATNLKRLEHAVNESAINAVIIKPNQAGSLIKTKDVFDYAVKKGITPVMSHRSGETMDTTIAHLAFAWQAPFVKFGIAGKERLAKLNELVKIERAAA
jgi:enolase